MCKEDFRHHGFHGHRVSHDFPFGGCCCEPTTRQFPSREEQVKLMKGYKKDLEVELAEVDKRLQDLKK